MCKDLHIIKTPGAIWLWTSYRNKYNKLFLRLSLTLRWRPPPHRGHFVCPTQPWSQDGSQDYGDRAAVRLDFNIEGALVFRQIPSELRFPLHFFTLYSNQGIDCRNIKSGFFLQKLYRFINCVELVSPHHAARELVHTIRQGHFTSLFQKSVKRVIIL